jgi:hypothetical protein
MRSIAESGWDLAERAWMRSSRASALQRKSHLCIPKNGTARPQSQFPHSCVWAIYIFPPLVCLFCCRKVYTVKKVESFPSPAGMSLPNSPWARIMTLLNYSCPREVWLVTSRLETGNSWTFFYGAYTDPGYIQITQDKLGLRPRNFFLGNK